MNTEKMKALRNSTACKRAALFDKIASSSLLSGSVGYDTVIMYLTDAYENAPEFKTAIDGVIKVCGELKVWGDVAAQNSPLKTKDEGEDEDEAKREQNQTLKLLELLR